MANLNLIKTDKYHETRKQNLVSFETFIRTFFRLRTGRQFELSEPIGRQSHYRIIIQALERVFRGETKRLIINVPPRYGKTELLIHFVAWTLAHRPDSNYIYVSYGKTLAKKQTQTIREIITRPEYKALFGVTLKQDTTAKDNFETAQNGSIYGTGAEGPITGMGAGIKECIRWGGCAVIDDIHKVEEATSDTMRENVINWYYGTMCSRVNNPAYTPIIYIGQRVHEDDLASRLIKSGEWETVIIPAIDVAGNALHPQMHNLKMLKKMQEENPYNFASQYQQDPQPSGGGLFKKDWFMTLEYEPKIIDTFITCDSAETDKSYNDATVFSFWGVYRIEQQGIDSGIYAIHWLDCWELRIEPWELQASFIDFYRQCMNHSVKPRQAYIEEKSTGTTLVSVMKKMQGLQTIGLKRDKTMGTKTERFRRCQEYVTTGRMTLPTYAKHTDMCIKHMVKITDNNTHRFDDIADTMADAIKIALIDESIGRRFFNQSNDSRKAFLVTEKLRRIQEIKGGMNINKVPF